MATVTGLTAARMLEIEAQTIVDGDIVGDNLILTRHDGGTVNAGNVRGPSGASPIATKLVTDVPNAYPIGISTFMVDASSVGWPAQNATITTVLISTSRAFQLLAEYTTSQMWVRVAADNAWGPWLSLTGTPAGSINLFAGAAAPAGFLLCDGSAISRATYAALFAVIGTTYGAGDGTTTFNLPNLKGKVPVGLDATQTEFDVLGETGGAKTVTLTANEMPVHTHTQNGHTHIQNSHTHTNTAHNHTQTGHDHTTANHTHASGALSGFMTYLSGGIARTRVAAGTTSDRIAFTGVVTTDMEYSTATAAGVVNPATTTAVNQAAAVTVDATTPTAQSTTPTNNNAGSGAAHANLQPYIVMNYIIKT